MTSKREIALLLPGGGALASYQAGAYKTLSESGIEPTWVAGISSGALNAAIIAGNPPTDRASQLRSFWQNLCKNSIFNSGYLSAWKTFLFGNESFFQPRALPAFLQSQFGYATASWYDAAPLRATLARFADFDRINDARQMRVSVGVVHVPSGIQCYFDNTRTRLTPEHFLASCALPPGFPPVKVDGEFYWDGGLVSNTPLECLIHENPLGATLAIQVDLWSSPNAIPVNSIDVATVMRDIQFLSKTASAYSLLSKLAEARRLIGDVLPLVNRENHEYSAYLRAKDYADSRAAIDLIRVEYDSKKSNSLYNTFDFSCGALRAHWSRGAHDMMLALDHWECEALVGGVLRPRRRNSSMA